jgi:hypothetical protein
MRPKTMSHKSQLSLSHSMSIHGSWGSLPDSLQDTRLLNPWIDYDSNVRPGLARSLKWNKVLGLGLVTAVSVSIWTGIVMVVERIWR